MKFWFALTFVVASTVATPLIQAQSTAVRDSEAEQVSYKLKGKKALYPDEIVDDGERTYIFWSQERELPAVFAIDEQKQEILVDGYMRDDYYTIDRVYGQLVFRLGKDVATAARMRGNAQK